MLVFIKLITCKKLDIKFQNLVRPNSTNAFIDICQIRLDFTNFVVAGPAVTTELIPTGASTVCQDSLVIAVSFITSTITLYYISTFVLSYL